ncbi:MAG: hypothetical protein HQK79_19865 [Desulfobacterales bacterium]|nr:hypothetical protein [Desulfobacterales bacterium]
MFFVYMDRVLFSEEFKQKILEEFSLSRLREAKIKFEEDEHYTTDKRKIDQLLGDE